MTAAPLAAVDKNSPVPLYHQVESQLEQAIRDGRYATGTLIESEFELARSLGVSRLTLRRAIDGLVSKGLLVRERGVGTRVVSPKVTRSLVARLTGLHEDLVRDGIAPVTEVLRLEEVGCPEASAHHLGIEPGEPVLLLERRRSVHDQPIALMWNIFPLGTIESTVEELTAKSLYQVMREQGAEPRVANQTIAAELPTAEDAELLDIEPSSPVLMLERTSFNGNGRCIEHSRTRYVADRYSFEMRLVTS